MKRITHLVFVSALVFGAHSAWSQEVTEDATPVAAESAGTAMSAADVGAYGPRESATMEIRAQKRNDLLETLGLSSGDGFPARGGPIDD